LIKLPILGLLETIAILGLGVVLKGAYSTGMLQVWYHSIGLHFILPMLEFEDGLSMSVLINRATRYKNLDLEVVKFLKKSNVFKRRPLHFIHELLR
jgi:hypothetical protein